MSADEMPKVDSHLVERPRPRVVAGYGRSGTTWVQDVLAISNELRPVFEPLHPLLLRRLQLLVDRLSHRYSQADPLAGGPEINQGS
jgi:hypothetical protein